MKKKALPLIIAAMFLITSCASRVKELPAPAEPAPSEAATPEAAPQETSAADAVIKSGYTVAVLPMYNATNDVAGAETVRNLFYVKARQHFNVKPLKEVDSVLLDRLGITLGSQLDMTTAQKLGEVLGVDGVIYGYLINYDDITTGVYNARRVRSGFKLVDVRSGEVIWSKGLGVKSVTGAVDLPVAGEVTLQGASDIPGINEWRTVTKMTLEEMQPQTKEGLVAAAALQAALTVLSLGLHFTELVSGSHMRTESAEMVGFITASMPAEKATDGARRQKNMPRLIFPAFTIYADRDFTASLAVTTVEKAGKGRKKKTTRIIKLAKLGPTVLSENYLERVTAIINRAEMKGYILYHASMKYTEVDLTGTSFDTPMTSAPAGEETVDTHRCIKSAVKFSYPDGGVLKGYIWRATDLDGFVVRAETDEEAGKTVVEVQDVSLKAPPASLFRIPEGYVKSGL